MYERPIPTIVLAGNPNVGKSTIFNCLTGLHQHTGNWSGKTVSNAEGKWRLEGSHETIKLIDAPGCYSLEASSAEEEVASVQICDPYCDGIIIVCDGTCLERNLILVLQILAHRNDVILCINLMDQVRKQGLNIDVENLQELLGVKVITTESSKKKEIRQKLSKAALDLLKGSTYRKARGYIPELLAPPEVIASKAEEIVKDVVTCKEERYSITTRIDRALTNPFIGYPIMFLMLLGVLWITIKGANYPSAILSKWLFSIELPMYEMIINIGVSKQVAEMLVFGMYRVLAWVISVMLPPMAIFFPLFTLLEDWGFLPRIAFNLDRCFKCCSACGKQALTMCMGLGCNASAVVGCRIIDSPRERLMAILTNSIIPCNGRFPILIAVITMFFTIDTGFWSAMILTCMIIISILSTLLATKVLSSTILKGIPSSFVLELPPYRKPEFGKVIVRSILDRTLFVLGRAIVVAAPAGIIIWILSNIKLCDESVITVMAEFLNPIGMAIGLDGVILVAFILGIPANEIVLPIIMMIYMSQGTLTEITDLSFFKELLVENGWTTLTAINMMIFSLMHWPCATTLLTIKKETNSFKWMILSFAVPLVIGFVLCFFTTLTYRFFL